MKKCKKILSALVLIPSLFTVSVFAADSADVILINADIRTSNPAKPRAEALAIKDGRFMAVGSKYYIKTLWDKNTKVIDAKGHTVLPGLIDAHTHLLSGIDLIRGVDLIDLNTKEAWLDAIAKRARTIPKGQWLVGGRWNVESLPDKKMPSLKELDAAVPDVPVALVDLDYHATWVNSKGMKLLGINEKTKSPVGGEIIRDSRGKLTGVFKENAQNLIDDNPVFIAAKHQQSLALQKVIHYFNSLGVTSVHDMYLNNFSEYRELLEKGPMNMRVWFGFMVPTEDKDSNAKTFDRYKQMQAEYNNFSEKQESKYRVGPQFRFGYIKYFIDGTLANYTAALNKPYADRRDHFMGKPIKTQENLNKLVQLANSAGFPVAVHAIGDRGVDMVLDAFAASKHSKNIRNRIEHVEVLTQQALPRFAQENVVASMQPDHAVGSDTQEFRLGKERLTLSYAWQQLLSSGATLVFGSDWPTVATANPMIQFNDAVHRSKHGKPWYIENALSFDEALYAFTQAPANLAGWGDEIGSIAYGKWADFIILDTKIKQLEPQDISNIKVNQTWFAGNMIYDRDK